MMFRVKASWRWLLLVTGVVFVPEFVFVALFVTIYSDPQDRQTPGQKLGPRRSSLPLQPPSFALPGPRGRGACGSVKPGIKLRYKFRTKEFLEEQIHS